MLKKNSELNRSVFHWFYIENIKGSKVCLYLLLLFAYGIMTSQLSYSKPDSLVEIKKLIKLKQYAEAKMQLTPIAKNGNAEAQYTLGILYRNGYMINENYKLAYYWFVAAAKNQHAQSIYALAMMHLKGQNVAADKEQARKLFLLSSKYGYKKAERQLSRLGRKKQLTQFDDDYVNFKKSIRTGDIHGVEQALAHNVFSTKTDKEGNTPQMLAVIAKQQGVLDLLIKKGSLDLGINRHGETMLMLAIKTGSVKMSQHILSDKSVAKLLNVQDDLGNTALLLALKLNLNPIVKKLIALGVNLNLSDKKNRDAYAVANDKGLNDIVKILRQQGYSKRNTDSPVNSFIVPSFVQGVDKGKNPYANWSALMIAAWRDDLSAVKDLVKTTKDINHKDIAGHSALSRAAWKGNKAIVSLLINRKADVHLLQNDGSTVMHWAAQSGKKAVLELLFQQDVDINKQRSDGQTALMIAVQSKSIAAVRYLIEVNADTEIKDALERTALIYAVIEGNIDIVNVLLRNSDSILDTDKEGHTALWFAIVNKRHHIAKKLMQYGSDVNKISADGETYITHAINSGNTQLVMGLLAHGARVNVTTQFGNTPLMIASARGDINVIRQLIEKKAKLNVKNNVGDTALILATKNGFDTAVSLLISAGADISKKNNKRQKALEIAEAQNNHAIIEMIALKKSEKRFWPF